MTIIKHILIPKRVGITKFQIFSIIFLLLFVVCDVFILKFIPSFSHYTIKWFCWFLLQLIFCILCLCKNYTGFCLNLRKSEELRQSSCPLKPQPLAFIHPFSNSPNLVVGFYTLGLAFFVSTLPSFILLEQVFPIYGIVITMIAIIVMTFSVITGNIFQFQYKTKDDESQACKTKNILEFIAMKRTPFLKIFLKLDLIVNAGFCIYNFCMDRAAIFFILFHYPISICLATINLYYTLLNMKAWFQPKIKILEEILEILLWTALAFGILWLMSSYRLFMWELPFWSYFLLFSLITAYILLLNKLGNYSFIDYELFDPNYVCFILLWKKCSNNLDVCQFCEYRNECTQHHRDEYCYFGSDPSNRMY